MKKKARICKRRLNMNKTTVTLIFVTASCLAMLVSIAVVAPKAVRAAVATLIRDQDNAARHAFVDSCTFPASGAGLFCAMRLQPGAEYVIQNVTVQAGASGATGVVAELTTTIEGSRPNAVLFQAIPLIVSGEAEQTYNIVAYADPGTDVVCGLEGRPSSAIISNLTCTISGYYVTLP
jgi:hypothetical protein